MENGAPAAIIILIITVGVSLYVMYRSPVLYQKMTLHPYSFTRESRWYTIITSGLIHGDLWHLMFNMISFYFFAITLEQQVGTENFLIIYIGSLILSDIPTIIKQKDNYSYRSLGASGAISGVIFSFILFFPTNTIYIYFIPMPAFVFAILFLAYGWYMDKKGMDYINHSAHNWGAVAGVVITLVLHPWIIGEYMNIFNNLIVGIFGN